MNIIPLFDKVVLKKSQKQQSSNIIIPSNQEDKPDIAQVHAVGVGGKIDGETVKMILKIGDKVLFNKFAGHEFMLNGELHILIKQSDILAIIEE